MTWMAPKPVTDITQPAHWVPPGRSRCPELRAWQAACGAITFPLRGMDSEFATTPRPVCETCAAEASDPYEGGYPPRRSRNAQ